MNDNDYRAHRRTEIALPRSDWFDADVPADDSNQRSVTGWFRMQVSRIDFTEYFGALPAELYVVGHRYKRDGTTGSNTVWAKVKRSQLPPHVAVAVRRFLPADTVTKADLPAKPWSCRCGKDFEDAEQANQHMHLDNGQGGRHAVSRGPRP